MNVNTTTYDSEGFVRFRVRGSLRIPGRRVSFLPNVAAARISCP
jgi:hypothetical protein